MSRDTEAPPVAAGDGAPTDDKEELRRRMEESRDAITETVGEIKAVVAQQYEEVRGRVESVREAAGEALDWREQFERNPVVWGAGAVSVGILVGLGLARALEDEEGDRSESLAGRAVGELTALADAVLPAISSQVKELFGLDLEAYLRETHRPRALREGAAAGHGGSKKKAARAGGRGGKGKGAAARKGAGERRAPAKGSGGAGKGGAKRPARKRPAG